MHATSNIKIRRKLGPHSRLLQRGVIGRSIDGRSTEGRYLRDFEARSIQHLGGSPSTTEQLLITRLARIALRIELFEEKMLSGNFTDHDGRVFGALNGAFLRSLQTLGLRPASERPLSPQEALARIHAVASAGASKAGSDL